MYTIGHGQVPDKCYLAGSYVQPILAHKLCQRCLCNRLAWLGSCHGRYQPRVVAWLDLLRCVGVSQATPARIKVVCSGCAGGGVFGSYCAYHVPGQFFSFFLTRLVGG